MPKAQVTDEDVNNRLESLRQRFGTLVGVDRPAAKGDFANIDLDAQIDGESRRLPGRRELRARLRHHAGRSGRGP